MRLLTARIDKPEAMNFVLGQTHSTSGGTKPRGRDRHLAVVQCVQKAGVLVQICVDAGRTEFHGAPTPT